MFRSSFMKHTLNDRQWNDVCEAEEKKANTGYDRYLLIVGFGQDPRVTTNSIYTREEFKEMLLHELDRRQATGHDRGPRPPSPTSDT